MPEVSRFYGVSIKMYHNDHNPPHFHAEYGEHEAVFSIATLEILFGKLPRRARNIVIQWAFEHRLELVENWELARRDETLKDIAPLD
jgi:hypothetical protein